MSQEEKDQIIEENEVQEQTSQMTEEESDQELESKDSAVAELKDKYVRLLAEFENFRKRSIREKMDTIARASQDTVKELLPVLDDFDRAKKSADDESSPEVFTEGVALVYDKLYKTLKNKGLEEMESTGVAFDPELHEAITKIPVPDDAQKGINVDTVEKGYILNGKIIRHAKVVVGQ